MATYIALFISLVSLILMIIILVRFKKLFSTDSIIEKTKSQMNRVITDVNANANRDMELINESSRRLSVTRLLSKPLPVAQPQDWRNIAVLFTFIC